MKALPDPIFQKDLPKISWTKIYEREYGVQYSEAAVGLLATEDYHFPTLSLYQVVVPGSGNNTAFYIDSQSWIELVEGLNKKYTSNIKNLEKYEKQFLLDGDSYLQFSKKIAQSDLETLSDKELLNLFLEHQNKKNRYSVFAWSAFILNNYVADRATTIIDTYISIHNRENDRQDIIDSLFTPHKRAVVLQLQYEIHTKGELHDAEFEDIYERYKWLSCLDIHNHPWTREEFKKHIEPFVTAPNKKIIPFEKIAKDLEFDSKDLEYLLMAKRFVYIKDARDDFRRESVYYAQNLFTEIGKRLGIELEDTSYLQEREILECLREKTTVDRKIISERKKGFVIYLDTHHQLVCIQGKPIPQALKHFNLTQTEEKPIEITGRIASSGKAKGSVKIVKGVKDLTKVKVGNVLVAVSTHPDFVSAMRKAVAIVTDEGGITSHAAIVSREFGIPCIVGCKNATKLLKDGDVIEVDAVNGKVIKIL